MAFLGFSGTLEEAPPGFLDGAPLAVCRLGSMPQVLRHVCASSFLFVPPVSSAAESWPKTVGLGGHIKRLGDASSLLQRSERYGNESTLSIQSITLTYGLQWWGPRYPGDESWTRGEWNRENWTQ